MTTGEYNAQSRAAFKEKCGLSDEELTNADAVFAKLPWLPKWRQAMVVNANNAWRDKGVMKKKLKKPVKNLIHFVRAFLYRLIISTEACPQGRWLYDNFDGVQLHGYIIDPKGQASSMWGCTPEYDAYRTKYGPVNVNQELKDLEHIFGCGYKVLRQLDANRVPCRIMEIEKRGLTSGRPTADLLPRDFEKKDGEVARDFARRLFTTILGKQMCKSVVFTPLPPT